MEASGALRVPPASTFPEGATKTPRASLISSAEGVPPTGGALGASSRARAGEGASLPSELEPAHAVPAEAMRRARAVKEEREVDMSPSSAGGAGELLEKKCLRCLGRAGSRWSTANGRR